MAEKKRGCRSFALASPPSVAGFACCVGGKEAEGPLGELFDKASPDPFFGQDSWEKAESAIVGTAYQLALEKAGMTKAQVELLFAGDLQSHCTGTSFGLRESGTAHFGVYGACSTMAESLALAAMCVDGGFSDCAAAATCSHFATAERQFRTPMEYGGQRTPSAQWTVTGAGAVILTARGAGPYVTHVTPGRIVDAGITDANNMGAAMAPAACDTLLTHFADTGRGPQDYDLIVTGDLGLVGSDLLLELLRQNGLDLKGRHTDCGLRIFDRMKQDVHAGGSGCGCSASVLTAELLPGLCSGRWTRILFAATGALLSTVSSQQGESIPGICCALALDREGGRKI